MPDIRYRLGEAPTIDIRDDIKISCHIVTGWNGLVWKESREFWRVISTCVWKFSDVKFRVLQKGFAHVWKRYRRNARRFLSYFFPGILSCVWTFSRWYFPGTIFENAYLVISVWIKLYLEESTKEFYCLYAERLGMNDRKPCNDRDDATCR